MPKKNNIEDRLQMAVATYLDFNAKKYGYRWFHPPNGGARGKAEAGIFKAMGVKPGVPDILIMAKGKTTSEEMVITHFGLAIELKATYDDKTKGRNSDYQKEWLEYLKSQAWRAEVCYNFDEAKEVIDDYFGII